MRPGHRPQHQGGVLDRARHRRHVGVVAERVGDLAVRDHAVALLEADHAVGRRRECASSRRRRWRCRSARCRPRPRRPHRRSSRPTCARRSRRCACGRTAAHRSAPCGRTPASWSCRTGSRRRPSCARRRRRLPSARCSRAAASRRSCARRRCSRDPWRRRGCRAAGPSASPFITSSSAFLAAAIACSGTSVMKQFSTGCSFSARASTAFISSTGETSFAADLVAQGRGGEAA